MNFISLAHDDMGIYRNENYRVVEALDGDIVFSYTRQGNALVIHLACHQRALRQHTEGFNSFCEWLFKGYPWCRMILGGVEQKSLDRMLKKSGCYRIAEVDDMNIYMRLR